LIPEGKLFCNRQQLHAYAPLLKSCNRGDKRRGEEREKKHSHQTMLLKGEQCGAGKKTSAYQEQ